MLFIPAAITGFVEHFPKLIEAGKLEDAKRGKNPTTLPNIEKTSRLAIKIVESYIGKAAFSFSNGRHAKR